MFKIFCHTLVFSFFLMGDTDKFQNKHCWSRGVADRCLVVFGK
jgi:hypothetical protein